VAATYRAVCDTAMFCATALHMKYLLPYLCLYLLLDIELTISATILGQVQETNSLSMYTTFFLRSCDRAS
jgi:hypothetical protein